LSHQRGNKVEQNFTHNKVLQSVLSSNAIVSVSFSASRCSSVVFSSTVGRDKKKRVCRQFCERLSAAVACLPAAVSLLLLQALFMQISVVSLALTWPPQALFTQSSPVHEPLLQAFPFPSTLGEVTLHQLSQACVFIYSSRGKWVFLPCPVGIPPSATLTVFPTPGCWVRTPLPPEPLQPGPACLFTVPGGIPLPPLCCSGCPTLFGTCLYCSYCLLFSFSFFPRWGSVRPGGYADLAQGCLWKCCILFSSPGLCLPKLSGRQHLVAQGPSWFLRLTWSGDALCRPEVWRSQSFASSRWSYLQGVSPASLQDFTVGGLLSASSL
jgi:hypothetical protein